MNFRHKSYRWTGLAILCLTGSWLLAQDAPSQAQLLERLETALEKPDPATHPDQSREQLDRLVQDAAQLARLSEPGRARLQALSIQMQGLALRVRAWPDDPQAEDLLWILRQAATQAAEQSTDEAPPTGAFWNLTADLLALSRSAQPAEKEKRLNEIRQKLESYLTRWPESPSSEAVREALKKAGGAKTPEQAVPAPPAYKLSAPKTENPNLHRYELTSSFQPAAQGLRVLTPNAFTDAAPGTLDVVFLLPVEAGEGREFGDPIRLIQEAGLHNRFRAVFILPQIAQVPWMVNASSDPTAQQESHMVQAVVPAVDQILGAKPGRRLLLGFSKSGWAAVHLLARYPGVFDAATGWDAPYMIQKPDRFELDRLFASEADFAPYVLSNQFRQQASTLKGRKRLALMGYDLFRDHLQQFHLFLGELGIEHDYADGPRQDHAWNTEWMIPAIDRLVQMPR